MLWLIDNQLARRNLSKFAQVQLRLIKKDIQLKTEAKEKQKETYPKKGQKGFQTTNVRQTFAEHSPDDKKVDAVIGKGADEELVNQELTIVKWRDSLTKTEASAKDGESEFVNPKLTIVNWPCLR